MEAIILAGGYGTRLQSVVADVPKPMADINGIPFLEILLKSLNTAGFTKVIIALHFMPEKIINYFGSKFENIILEYVVEKVKLGTGGAIKNSLKFCNNNHVYVLNGDTFLEIDYSELDKLSKEGNIPIMVGKNIENVSRYGEIEYKDNIVTGFLEKGKKKQGVINAGCYIIPTNIFNKYNIDSVFSFETDFLVKYIDKLKFYLYMNNGMFIDIGVPDDLYKARDIFINPNKKIQY